MAPQQSQPPAAAQKRNAFSWFTDANYFAAGPGFAAKFVKAQLKPLPEPKSDFTGKTVIVTGGNTGLGREAARHFARLGAAKVILACRDTAKGEVARADIEVSTRSSRPSSAAGVRLAVEVWQVDMSSGSSVREFCARVDRELPRLDCLVLSAGVAIGSYVECEGGWESTVAVNIIGTFLMALLCLPLMRRTAAKHNVETRIAVVASEAHLFASFAERKRPGRIFDAFRSSADMNEDRYNTSKLLNILIARELAARLGPDSPVLVNSLNPGLCKSELFRHCPFPLSILLRVGLMILGRTTEMGSRTLVAAAAAGRDVHGKYMDCCKVAEESAFARSEDGRTSGVRVFDELVEILEGFASGVSHNLTTAPAPAPAPVVVAATA